MYPEQSGLVRRISQYFGPKQSKIASEEGLNEKLHKKQAIATQKKTNATISKINPKILSLVVGKFVFFFICMVRFCVWAPGATLPLHVDFHNSISTVGV